MLNYQKLVTSALVDGENQFSAQLVCSEWDILKVVSSHNLRSFNSSCLNSRMMKRTSVQMTGSHGVLVFISFQRMTVGNILSLSVDITSCTPQFFLSVLACGCMWVCGWDADADRTWHSPTSNISVKTISCWFYWFFYHGSSVDIQHTEEDQQLHKQLFSPVCFQSTALLWAHFVSIGGSVSLRIHISHIEYKICFFF